MYKILVTLPMRQHHKAEFEKAAVNCAVTYSAANVLTSELVKDADIIIGNIKPSLLAENKNLKWVQLSSAGSDVYAADGILDRSTILTNATGAYGSVISEHMLAVLLTLMKKIHLYQSNQAAHIWRSEGNAATVAGSKALIVGAGNIGGEFAKKLYALGCSVTGIRRHKVSSPEYIDGGMYLMEDMPSLLPSMDIVAASLPNTKDTYKVFDKDAFAQMKVGSYFINVGRGSAVDSDALAEALNSGHLRGAALDVTDPEPLPEDHPLWDAKNIIITPHISGMYNLPETLDRLVEIARYNLNAFLTGGEMKNVVDFETGYRAFKE